MSDLTPPAVPPALAKLLESKGAKPYGEDMMESLRVCWRLHPERRGRLDLGLWDRLRRRPSPSPSLPPEASKLNGVPYLKDESHWPRSADGPRQLSPTVIGSL